MPDLNPKQTGLPFINEVAEIFGLKAPIRSLRINAACTEVMTLDVNFSVRLNQKREILLLLKKYRLLPAETESRGEIFDAKVEVPYWAFKNDGTDDEIEV